MIKKTLVEDGWFHAIGIEGKEVKVYTKIEKIGDLYMWNMSYFYSPKGCNHPYMPSRSESTLRLARLHLKVYCEMIKSGVCLIPNYNY